MGGTRDVNDSVFSEKVCADLGINLKIKLIRILKEENGIL